MHHTLHYFTGRCAFTRRLKAPTEQVIWHEETGDYYLLVSARDIQVCVCSDVFIIQWCEFVGTHADRHKFTSNYQLTHYTHTAQHTPTVVQGQ